MVKAALLTGFLGLTLGVLIFYATFPNASVPSAGEASLTFTVGTLLASALLVGILSDDLLVGILQAFLSIPAGATVASVLILSPVFAGLQVVRPDDLVLFIIRSGLPFFFAMIPLNVIGIFVGAAMREKLRLYLV